MVLLYLFTFGTTLCSGPSNVAVDNLAERTDRVDRETCDRYNSIVPLTCKEDRCIRRLVIRGYAMKQELAAFNRLLEDPEALEAPEHGWSLASKWKLPNSLAFWLLVCLNSRATREIRAIDQDDNPVLHDIQDLLQDQQYESLRDVAAGTITWEEYTAGDPIDDDTIQDFFVNHLIRLGDVLCTTPALTETEPAYRKFKQLRTQAVVVDEAGNMERADLACVWGNTALPCFVAGDPLQLPPTVLSGMEKDAQGNVCNRFANDGAVSALEWLQKSGMTVFRPRFQFRMAEGLFDYVGELVYSHVNFTYGPNCGVHLPKFAPGRVLEAFIQATDSRVTPAPSGKFLPAFLHCPRTKVKMSAHNTTSRLSPDQAEAGLNFILGFLNHAGRQGEALEPENITVIAPYAANVQCINKLLRSPEYADLAGMAPASTVDSFQGREGDIVVLIMGTNDITGPGFTANEKRLNVMVTRQRCGLVIVGDFGVVGNVEGGPRERVVRMHRGVDGKIKQVNMTMLWNLMNRLYVDGRVMHLPADHRELWGRKGGGWMSGPSAKPRLHGRWE